MSSNPNWVTRPRHMLEIRTLKQNARQIIHGIPFDEDERKMMEEINVTPGAEGTPPVPERPKAPKREAKGAAAVVENRATTPPPAPEKEKSNVIEGTFTEVKATPPPAEEPKAPPAAKAEEPPPAETPQAPTPTNGPRAFLKDGETAIFDCEIVEAASSMGRYKGADTPLTQSTLKGQFNGTVVHFNGATTTDGKAVTPLPIYKTGTKARFTLTGKLNARNNKMTTLVDKVEAIPASPDSVDVE